MMAIKDWVRKSYPPDWVKDQLTSHEKRIGEGDQQRRELQQRVLRLEDAEQP